MNENQLTAYAEYSAEATDKIVAELLTSPNLCDQRKGRDLRELMGTVRGLWKDRFRIRGFGAAADRSLVLVCELLANGHIWDGQRAKMHDCFNFLLAIGHNYPLAMPFARFGAPAPWNTHVLHHAAHLPDRLRLPPELQAYLQRGHAGECCYLRSSQWTGEAATNNLCMVVWQLSRLLTGSMYWGEVVSLNPAARDLMQTLKKQGRLPLGPPLPLPSGEGTELEASTAARALDEDTEDIEWAEERVT